MRFLTAMFNYIIEPCTKFISVIQSDHAYIHKGIAYTGIIDTGSISAAYDIAFTTPTVASGKYIHWRPLGLTTSANYVQAELREADSFSAGTAVVPINRDRSSSNTTSMQTFVKGATATPVGTLIDIDGIGASGNPTSRSGGGAGANEELILKQNTNYVLTLTPAGATVCTAKLFWYEED